MARVTSSFRKEGVLACQSRMKTVLYMLWIIAVTILVLRLQLVFELGTELRSERELGVELCDHLNPLGNIKQGGQY